MRWLWAAILVVAIVGCGNDYESPVPPGTIHPHTGAQPGVRVVPATDAAPTTQDQTADYTTPPPAAPQETMTQVTEKDYLIWLDGVRNTAVQQLPLDRADDKSAGTADFGLNAMNSALSTVNRQSFPPGCSEVREAFVRILQANIAGLTAYKNGDLETAKSSLHEAKQLEDTARSAMNEACQKNGLTNLWPEDVRFP